VVYALINRGDNARPSAREERGEKLPQQRRKPLHDRLGISTAKDKHLTIDDHVNGYMDNIVEVIKRREQVDRINLMGICMGGTFCVIYSALHPENIRNLVTTVCPTNFDTDKGLLHIWMRTLDADRIVDTFGNMPGDLMNFGFLLLNPARLMIDKYVGFLENMDKKDFVENFVRMEKWIFDSPDVPGETFRQFIKDCYQKNLLILNRLMVGDRRVDLGRITMPLLNIYGQYDHLVPPEAAEKLPAAVGSRDTENICLDTGHIGIYVSGKTQREFTPKIVSWLKEREDGAGPSHRRSEKAKRPAPGRVLSVKKKPSRGKIAKEMTHAG
jgi:polyhydroxyalkanoate synthase